MFWARISRRRKIPLVSVENKINAEKYDYMLEKDTEL